MDQEEKNFGRGPRELTGTVDLISRYKLVTHLEFFHKRSLPLSISESRYLHNVVGDAEIRKGEGMQLDQLVHNASYSRDTAASIKPFALDNLREAFQIGDTTPIDLPAAEKGIPTFFGKTKIEAKEKEKKRKKHEDIDKGREHKKHKYRHRDMSKDKVMDKEEKKDRSEHRQSGEDRSKKNHDTKRKHDGDEKMNDIHRHKKSKNKSSKIDEMGAIKTGG